LRRLNSFTFRDDDTPDLSTQRVKQHPK
jgi:hypothetical protein